MYIYIYMRYRPQVLFDAITRATCSFFAVAVHLEISNRCEEKSIESMEMQIDRIKR